MQGKIRGGRKEEKGTYLFTKTSKQFVKEEREKTLHSLPHLSQKEWRRCKVWGLDYLFLDNLLGKEET